MKPIMLNYDDTTGAVSDAAGNYIGSFLGIKPVEPETLEVSKLIKLKDAGFDTDEIIKMHKERIL